MTDATTLGAASLDTSTVISLSWPGQATIAYVEERDKTSRALSSKELSAAEPRSVIAAGLVTSMIKSLLAVLPVVVVLGLLVTYTLVERTVMPVA